MKLVVYGFVLIMMGVSTQLHADSQVSEADKKLLVASLYLSHCVFSTGDFRKAIDRMDKSQLSAYNSKVKGQLAFVDRWAVAKINLAQDYCVVEIKSNQLSKLASSLKQVLEVSGGKLDLKAVDQYYAGELKINKEAFNVEASFFPKRDDFISAGIFRK